MNNQSQESLSSVKWKRFLRSPDSELTDQLYAPALSRAVSYDRCCAYFSSRVLSVAARGFGGLIERILACGDELPRPAIRLLINEQLDREDRDALLTTGDQSPLLRRLLSQFNVPATALEKNRLEMLSWLVASGWLELRVGVMRRSGGILHAKFGIVTDRHGDRIAFMGSDNETGAALTENYEELEIRSSWEDREFTDYYQERFETLWNDRDSAVTSVSLPDAVRRELIKFAPIEPPKEIFRDLDRFKATLIWNFIAAAPYLPNGETACDATALVDLWPHQKRVIDDTSSAFPSGRLLCDEVGMGKTIEAICIIRRLLCGRGVKRVLLLVPAGLLKQWQGELREKGGLLVPRWERKFLHFPGGESHPIVDISEVLKNQDLLLLSREWARLPSNRKKVMSSPMWDLVLLDEGHAARRSSQEEREFNSGNLLLELLRELQLKRQTKGLLLLSATPMQTQPWEPWDLLAVLGVGGEWMVEFDDIRTYYGAIGELARENDIDFATARRVARLIASDDEFPSSSDQDDLIDRLTFSSGDERKKLSMWLREGSPLSRRMHRNTRDTLRKYHERGLIESPPPRRDVQDVLFDYDYQLERDCYDAISDYIHARYEQLEREKKGKGFVMTIYRRRAASSPRAIRCSLKRRLEGLESVIRRSSWIGDWYEPEDLVDVEIDEEIDPALPTDPRQAQLEKEEIEVVFSLLERLGSTDSKFARFQETLSAITADGRPVLVFTEYTDTLRYLQDLLLESYGKTLGTYSGAGGQIWDGNEWQSVSKAEITDRHDRGELRVLVCTDAASEGLNLQAAGALINYDLPWNPSKVEQRIGRIDRIGQERGILPIRNLFLDSSIDLRVYQVLRQRCRLFEHFVGRMQPVLALAKQLLHGIVGGDEAADEVLDQLERKADQVEKDQAIASTFVESEVAIEVEETPVMERSDFGFALELLERSGEKIEVKRIGEKRWRLMGLGKASLEVTTARSVMERDETVMPLTVTSSIVEKVAAQLPMPSLSPLILAESRRENHRCISALWIGGDQSIELESIGQLIGLVEHHDGSSVEEDKWLKAFREAKKCAKDRQERQSALDFERRERDISLQHLSAKLRLKRELGRTLRCFGVGSLNSLLDQRIQRKSERYRQALEKLGGKVVWTEKEIAEIEDFVSGLPKKKRRARLTGSEVDAALGDRRWETK